MGKSPKKQKWSTKRSKKCKNLLHDVAAEVNTPATLHCFEVSEDFDTAFWNVYGRENKFKSNFERYIGIQSFTAFNQSTRKVKKKKRRNKEGTQKGILMRMLQGIGRFFQSCIVSA